MLLFVSLRQSRGVLMMDLKFLLCIVLVCCLISFYIW